MRICKKHGELNDIDLQRGVYRGKPYVKCKHCNKDRAAKHSKKVYSNADLLKQKHDRDKLRWETKKEEIKKQRMEPASLLKRREAYKKLAPHYRESCNRKQQQYRNDLHDTYIRKMIQAGDKNLKFNNIPQSMVEAKRALIKLKKGIKQHQLIKLGEKIDD